MATTKPYKWTLQKIKKSIDIKGGKCLSIVYINPRVKMLWQCKNGHLWKTTFDSIRRGSWCLQCRKNRPLTIKDMQMTAKEKGGRCLSRRYTNSQTKLKWQCLAKHTWWATPNNIRRGEWCPRCSARRANDNKRFALDDMKNWAKRKGGRCLSKRYLEIDTKLIWKCSRGHIWRSTPYMVKIGYWCRICSGHPKITLREMRRIAKNRGGKCLSNKYINDSTKMKWMCANGHIWQATANNVRQGKWCLVCSGSRSERIVRTYFEQIFGVDFPISYPNWLLGSKGKTMQLDGYNDRLKLAFEYQGKQHYEYSKYYHSKKVLKNCENTML